MQTSPVVRKLQAQGVRLERPRWFSFLHESYRPASAEEVEQCLEQGKSLRAWIPGASVPLAVHTEQDLRELAYFQAGESADLERPELASGLNELARHGWQFRDEAGEQVGPYGAYNALTDGHFSLKVSARKEERSVPLASAEKATEMATFYVLAPTEEARCEEAGYRFFNGQGQVEPAFVLQGGEVGREQPWVARGEALGSRLQAFEALQSKLGGDVDLARAVDRAGPIDLEAARGLLEGRSQKQRDRLAPLLGEALGDQLESLILPSDRAMMLERLGDDPRAELIKVAESDAQRQAFFRSENLLDLCQQEVSEPVAAALVAALASRSSTAAAVQRWQPDHHGRALKSIGANPAARGVELCRLATEIIPWDDQAAHRNHLAEFAYEPDTATLARACQRVHEAVTTPETRWAVWKAFAEEPAGSDVFAFGQRIYDLLETVPDKNRPDARELGRALLAELPPSPLAGLGDLPADRLARRWTQNPKLEKPAELGALAAEVITWDDQEAHRKFLHQLASNPETRFKAGVAERLHDLVQAPETRWAIWKACVLSPEGNGEEAVSALARGANELVERLDYEGKQADLKLLARATNRELVALGVGASALAALERWGVADTDLAEQGLARYAGAELGELAVNSIGWKDAEAHRKVLTELGPPAALRVHDAVESEVIRWAIFKAGAQLPKADPIRLARETYAILDKTEVEIPDKAAQLDKLAVAFLQEMAGTPEADAVARWGLSSSNLAARALAADPPPTTLGELAAKTISWSDEKGHRAVLADLAADPATRDGAERALRVHDRLKSGELRWAVWKAHVLAPGSDALEHARKTLALVEEIKNVDIPDRPAEMARLAEGLLSEIDSPGALALRRWGVASEVALNGLLENPAPVGPAGLGQLAAASIAWTDQQAHRCVLQEFSQQADTKFLAGVASRLHEEVTAPETRWAVWKACAVAPEGFDLSAYRERVSELLASVPSYAGRAEDVELLFNTLLASEEVHRLVEGARASSQGLAVEKERVLVGGVVLRNRRGADPPAPGE